METENILTLIDRCREILESKGEVCPVYVSFERDEYTLTNSEINELAKCLYLTSCHMMDSNIKI